MDSLETTENDEKHVLTNSPTTPVWEKLHFNVLSALVIDNFDIIW